MARNLAQVNFEEKHITQKTKTVVMACTHPYWSVLQVGSQHLARQFAKNGWNVHYISAPVTPLHLTGLLSKKAELAKRFKCALNLKPIHEKGNLFSHIPFSLIAPTGQPLLRNRVITHHWHQTMIPSSKYLEKSFSSHSIDLLYIDNLSYHFLLDKFSYKKSIFRIMDFHEGFSGWKGKAQKQAMAIAEKSDLTIYSAQSLKNYADSLKPQKSAFVPNGVDNKLFSKTAKAQQDHYDYGNFSKALQQNQGDSAEKNNQLKINQNHRHPLLQHIKDPIVLYTGMIDSRIDVNLVRFAAKKLPDVSFVFSGIIQESKRFKNLPENIYFTGPVSHDEIPFLMQDAFAGMIPFDVKNNKKLIRGIRPLKLLEYLAAGLLVISACWPEIKNMNSPAWIYNSEQDFVDLVSKAVHSKQNNSAAITYASHHDWKHSYDLMLGAL